MFTVESGTDVCKQCGLTTEEMEEMTIGDCLDFIQEFVDNQKKTGEKKEKVRKATQKDFDSF